MTVEHPIVFLVCMLTVLVQFVVLFLFRHMIKRGKQIPQIFMALTIIILMMFCGTAISVLTDSSVKITIILTLSLGFSGAIEYIGLRMFKFI